MQNNLTSNAETPETTVAPENHIESQENQFEGRELALSEVLVESDDYVRNLRKFLEQGRIIDEN